MPVLIDNYIACNINLCYTYLNVTSTILYFPVPNFPLRIILS